MSPQRFDPLTSAAPLIVYIDYKSPYAYLAVAPTYALADELGVAIDWQPLVGTPPSSPPTGNDRGARHRRIRADYLERDVVTQRPYATESDAPTAWNAA